MIRLEWLAKLQPVKAAQLIHNYLQSDEYLIKSDNRLGRMVLTEWLSEETKEPNPCPMCGGYMNISPKHYAWCGTCGLQTGVFESDSLLREYLNGNLKGRDIRSK